MHNRKWQQIEDAQKVAIRDDTVSTIGEGIAEVAAFITEMDLQDNLLWEWEEVCASMKLFQIVTRLHLFLSSPPSCRNLPPSFRSPV